MQTYGGVGLVVSQNVPVEGAQKDHGYHGGQEDGDEDGIDETEPLDVGLANRT